jgi:ABC-2 type transport system ATP-binding protein
MSEAAVAVADVEKAYGERTALAGVSLAVEAGEVHGLLGPNGAGKTTLVRAITGTTAVDGGSVSVFGVDPAELPEARLGVLPQQFDPPERLTARELLRYFAGLYDEARDPDAVLGTVGMADDADTWYGNLSGGQQRRVCLGIALVNDPDLLVLDEPTTGIDPAGRRQVRDRIGTLAAGGTTVLVTSHDIDEVERLADRVTLLAAGEVVATGAPAELVAEHGGRNRLLVETDADPAAVDGYAASRVEEGLVFADVDPDEIGGLVDALTGSDVEYEALRWSRPGLEDVYLQLTGSPELAGVVGAGDLNRTAAVADDAAGPGEGRSGVEGTAPTADAGGDR